MVLAGVVVGLVFAAIRIVWLIVAAVFLYDIAVETGQFEMMKASIARLSADRRLQAVLVAFCFGALIEGAAGFGAPVAISAAFLVGLGFRPFQAALLCLIANTAPVAWGGIGIPILTLSTVTGLDVNALSATSGRILPILSVVIPFWLVATLTSWRKTWEVRFPLLVIGGTFAAVQFVWSNFVGLRAGGHRLVGLEPAAPAWSWCGCGGRARSGGSRGTRMSRADGERGAGRADAASRRPGVDAVRPVDGVRAGLGDPASKSLGTPAVKEWLDRGTSWKPELPRLHLKVARGRGGDRPRDARGPGSREGPARNRAALGHGHGRLPGGGGQRLALGVPAARMARLFARTVRRMVPAIAAILCMLSLGFVTKYAGMDAVLGLAFTRTGRVSTRSSGRSSAGWAWR